MTPPIVEIANVSWRYAGASAPALNRLNLSVAPGETVVLCGASGSGKSTALRLVNGLIPHFHRGSLDGTVLVNGTPVTEQPPDTIGRHTGTVLQHPRRQFFTDTVDTELAFAMENFGEPPSFIRGRVAATLTSHQLGDLTRRRLLQLSGGQQQQVALAAATAHRPALVLLDEPTANLSAAAVDRFLARLAEFRAAGVTVLIAEHRLHRLTDVADRIVLFQDGSVTEQWSSADFARLPDHLLVAKGLRSGAPTANRPPPAPSQGANGLTMRGIRCTRGGRPVLDIPSAHFPAGAVTAVTGPNGAGKSTLARVLTGLQRHDGDVTLDGRRMDRRRRLANSALVMQDVQRQLFTDSVGAELRLGAAHPTGTLLPELGLADLDDRHPLALSGGQQQRLVVAVARLSGRQIVVFDEPSSGVDSRHLASITAVLRDLAADGAVVVLISHDDELVTHAADLELKLPPVPNSAESASVSL